jgi:ABC-type glycerol-3-phosphate transport system substrate-binding protein
VSTGSGSSRIARRKFLRMTAMAVGGLALGACAPKPAPSAPTEAPSPAAQATAVSTAAATLAPKSPVTISMITHWGVEPGADGIEPKLSVLKHRFEEANPDVKVDIVMVPGWDNADAKTQAECGAGNCPDVAFNGFVNMAVVDAGLVLPTDDFIAQHKDVIDMNYLGPRYKDHYWAAFSEEINAFVCMYNREVLAELGLTAFPKTWDELLAVGEALKAKGKALTTLRAYWPWVFGWIQESTQAGAKAMEAGEWDSPTFLETMKYFQKLVPYLSPDELELDDRTAPLRVKDGDMLFYTDGQWTVGNFAFEPVEQQQELAAKLIGTAPFPTPPGLTFAGWNPYAIGTGAYKHEDLPERMAATWRFLEFWCSDEEVAKVFITTGSPGGFRTDLIPQYAGPFLAECMAAQAAADRVHQSYGAWAAADTWGAVQPAFEALTLGKSAEEATTIMTDLLRQG